MSLTDALTALHDPTTPPAQRHAAHVFCEQYKDSAAARLPEVLPLLHSSQPLHARHFGLHVVDGVVRSQWSSLSSEAQLELRRSLLSVACDGLLPLLQEAHVVREKLAALLVTIGRRDWPARWTTMLPELVQLATAGATQTHLVLLVMRTLIEEVFAEEGGGPGGGGANGSASAATDPRSALTASAADMLEWLHQCLQHNLGALQAAVGGAASADAAAAAAAAQEQRLMLRATVGALHAYAQHLPLPLLLARGTLIGEVVLLLGDAAAPQLRDAAAEMLTTVLGTPRHRPTSGRVCAGAIVSGHHGLLRRLLLLHHRKGLGG